MNDHYDALLTRFSTGNEPPLLMVVGLGQGELLEAMERRGMATRVLAIEPVPSILGELRARRDWTPWLETGRLTLLVGPGFSGATDAWKLLGKADVTPPMIVSPALEREYPDAVAGAKALARQIVLGAKSNEEARRQFAGRYLLNTLKNVVAVTSEGDVAALADAFAGVPALVIGAGPSLDRNLAEIRAVADRVLLIAVDTAARALIAGGVYPHIVVSVDPSEENARHLIGISSAEDIHLVTEASVDPGALAPFAGRTFTFKVSNHQPWPWLAGVDANRGSLRAWGSVLTTAFDLARVCGCGPIVFAGTDLAYTDGQLYSRNTVYEAEWQGLASNATRAAHFRQHLAKQKTVIESDITGTPTQTAPRFLQFRDWLVRQAPASGRVVNATGAGILHGGGIQQASLTSLKLAPLAPDAADIRGRLRRAWSATADAAAGRRARVRAGLSARSSLPFDTWLEFAGASVERADVERVLDLADRQLSKVAPRDPAGYLAMLQDWYNERVVSLDDGRAMMHADYDYARTQAPAGQSHVLLDFLQRTYAVDTHATVHGTLLAASSIRGDVRALDVGCGLGRGMEPLAGVGIRVDGVDISARILDLARQNPKLSGSQFFTSRGNDCGDAPEHAYDLAYSQFCLQHIPARSIRSQILAAMARALRPGGVVSVLFHFYGSHRVESVPAPHVGWGADNFDAAGGNGVTDVWVTPDVLPQVLEDFSRHFVDVRLQFVDFARDASLIIEPDGAWFSHLIVSGSTRPELAARVYAPVQKPGNVASQPAGLELPLESVSS